MRLYETETPMNEATFKEIGGYLMPRGATKFLFTMAGIVGLFAGLHFSQQQPLDGIINSVITLSLIGSYFLIKKQKIKTFLQRLQEDTNQESCRWITAFNEEGFDIINPETNGQTNLAYKHLAYFGETKNFYIIMTKSLQFGLVNKQTLLQHSESEAFLTFLKQHHIKKFR